MFEMVEDEFGDLESVPEGICVYGPNSGTSSFDLSDLTEDIHFGDTVGLINKYRCLSIGASCYADAVDIDLNLISHLESVRKIFLSLAIRSKFLR